MAPHRFYIPPEQIIKNEISASGSTAHRIRNVLRLGVGDETVVFDGAGREYLCEIKKYTRNDVILIIKKKLKNTGDMHKYCNITLAQALPKKAKMDYIVQKACELGARAIMPIISERTVVKLDPRAAQKKVERWRKISQEAAGQSGHAHLAQVSDVKTIEQVMQKIPDYELAIMFCINDKAKELKGILRDRNPDNILVMIGPEGDFSGIEAARASKSGAQLASLGKYVLKVDTAAIAALSILNYELCQSVRS